MSNDERGFLTGGDVEEAMHPSEVVHLEHDGKVLLVDERGNGPLQPVKGRFETDVYLRFPARRSGSHGD